MRDCLFVSASVLFVCVCRITATCPRDVCFRTYGRTSEYLGREAYAKSTCLVSEVSVFGV